MANENERPPLARRVPGATRAAPADPERREPPELPEEVRQRIQAVVNAAHAQAALDLEAQHEEEARRGQLQPDQPVRRKRSGKVPRRVPDAVNGATSPEGMPRSERPSPQPPRQWPDVDAEFDTSPLPRLTASGAIASPEAPNGPVKPDLANKQRQTARQEQERGAQHKRTARQARIAQRERAAAQELAVRQAQERARQEQERAAQEHAAQERARQEEEHAAQERARLEEERTAEQRARLEQERARLEQERAAEEQASQERARQLQESLARQEQKSAAKQEHATKRKSAAERRRAAKQQRERAAQELIEQKRAAQERARQEQERAAEELARQLEELAAQERIRQEQELEDLEWAAQKRARLEREREEAEELARREQGAAEHNGAAQSAPRQLAAAVPARAHLPAQPQPRVPEAPGSRRYRTSALIAAVVVLVGAGSLAIARSLHTSAHAPTRAVGITTVTRNEAAAWVAQQVSGAVVSCDPVMCQALRAHGVLPDDLLELLPKTRTPAGSQIVVATAVIRDQFGSRLASAYAPAVLASFGSGKARIDIRQIVPNGAAAYRSALNADLQNRKKFESLLVGNYLQVAAAPRAHKQLLAGQVDTRLGLLIEGIAIYLPQPVEIVAFGDLGPGASAGIPLRSATLAGSKATLRSMLAWTRSKAARPYNPTHAEITQVGGQQVLIVEFAAPIQLGLFGNPSP
jgi:hypothetical protein